MKKHLFLLFALFVNLCAFASKDVVPSDAVLAGYYDQGQVCVCFFVPADMACNDIVLTGSFNGWSSDVAECVRVEAVEGYDGWYVGSFEPEAEPDAVKGIQVKPVMLDVDGNFNWEYQPGAATILRGSMEIVQIMVGEIELINYGTDAPNVFIVDGWKKNPCTEPYHNYHFEVISDGCGGNVVPFIVGGMNLWKFEQMQLDEEKTVTNGAPTYYYNKKLPEGTEYQIASGMMDDNGVVPTEGDSAVGWKDIAYMQEFINGYWARIIGGDNFVLGEETTVVFDLREDTLRWARCDDSPVEHVVMSVRLPIDNCPPEGVEIIGTFDGWEGTPMELLDNGWWFVELEAKVSQYFKFRSEGSWNQVLEIYNAENDEWAKIGDGQFRYGQLWKDGSWNETPCKLIELDWRKPDMYRWSGESGVAQLWILTVGSNPSIGGYVSGGGKYHNKTKVKITATPNYGYRFVQWSDGITDNPRTIQITQDTTFVAEFAKNPTITYVCEGNGYINGNTSIYDAVGEVTFTAIPYDGNHFVQWSDGITDNPRTIMLTKDTTFTAEFAVDMSGKCGDNLVWALTDNALTIIGSGAMWDEQPWGASRESIKQVNLPQGLTYIGNYAFEGLTSLTTLSIPRTVENVGRQPFYGCSNITSFVGPVVAFNSLYSEKVQSLTLNGGVLNDYNHLAPLSEVLEKLDLSGADCSVLPKRALYDFYLLRELALPANLETIGYMSVAECVNLKKVEIPASVITIDQRAFENCRSLSDLTFAEGSQLETIGSWAFYNCHNLPKIEIPEGVTEIGDAAFYGCVYAESLKLPASVQSLGDNAFALCSKLNRMDVDAVVPPTIVAKTFNEVSRKAPVYVPDESVTLYKADPLWNELNIVGQHESPTAVETISNDQLPITNKILRDGQILILRGEKVYTVTGQEVR